MNNYLSRLWSIPLILIFAVLSEGCEDETTIARFNNNGPVITSMYAFPSHVQSSDSFVVVCSAYEPDGDSLFYDWSCTSGASIKGAYPPRFPYLSHTRENTRIFYAPDSAHTLQDSIRVFCDVRDGKGGGTTSWVLVALSR